MERAEPLTGTLRTVTVEAIRFGSPRPKNSDRTALNTPATYATSGKRRHLDLRCVRRIDIWTEWRYRRPFGVERLRNEWKVVENDDGSDRVRRAVNVHWP